MITPRSNLKRRESCNNNVKVAVRIRPFNENENATNMKRSWSVDSESSCLIDDENEKQWHMDSVFPENSNAMEVYNTSFKPIIDSWITGYPATAIVFGQTCAGKTYTVQQMIPLIFEEMFSLNYFDDLEISYVQVYNEQVLDLISGNQVSLQETKSGNVMLSGATTTRIRCKDDALSLIKTADTLKYISATGMNDQSSRSHTILRIGTSKHGAQFHVVDLAGSESMRSSMVDAKSSQATEAANINKSLLSLSLAVYALSRGKPALGLRTSKLTRILKPSLSGMALISIICCISPTVACVDESRNTLQFARTARKINISCTRQIPSTPSNTTMASSQQQDENVTPPNSRLNQDLRFAEVQLQKRSHVEDFTMELISDLERRIEHHRAHASRLVEQHQTHASILKESFDKERQNLFMEFETQSRHLQNSLRQAEEKLVSIETKHEAELKQQRHTFKTEVEKYQYIAEQNSNQLALIRSMYDSEINRLHQQLNKAKSEKRSALAKRSLADVRNFQNRTPVARFDVDKENESDSHDTSFESVESCDSTSSYFSATSPVLKPSTKPATSKSSSRVPLSRWCVTRNMKSTEKKSSCLAHHNSSNSTKENQLLASNNQMLLY